MSITLPGGLGQAFATVAGELGHAGAATLFVQEIAALHGEAGVTALRDALGRDFPVADAVAARWLAGWRPARPDPGPILRHLAGIRRLAIVGVETPHIDVLVDALPDCRIALLTWSTLPADWDRVVGNQGGRIETVDLDGIFAWAGPDSAVLSFVYGAAGDGQVFVPPAWLRLSGPDMRPRFRGLLGWNVMPTPFAVYPRWFHEVPDSDFTAIEAA